MSISKNNSELQSVLDSVNNLVHIDLTDDTVTPAKMLSGTKAHDKSGSSITGTIPSQAAQTIIPGTSDQTIASGKYLTGDQTIKGDANLAPENIASGVSIFGVEGTLEAGGGGSSGEAGGVTLRVTNSTGYFVTIGAVSLADGESTNICYSPIYLAAFDAFIVNMYAVVKDYVSGTTITSTLNASWKSYGDGVTLTQSDSFEPTQLGIGAVYDMTRLFLLDKPVATEFELTLLE